MVIFNVETHKVFPVVAEPAVRDYVRIKYIIFLGLPLPRDMARLIMSFLCPAGAWLFQYPWYWIRVPLRPDGGLDIAEPQEDTRCCCRVQ